MSRRLSVTPDRAVILAGTVLIVVLVAGFLVLSVRGIDTGAYALFCAGPVTTTIIGAVVTRKVSDVAVAVQAVEQQVVAPVTPIGRHGRDEPPVKPDTDPPLRLV